jgi:hypothetical protein
MTDQTDDQLESMLNAVKWGDYQRTDGRLGRGVGNRDDIKQAIRQLIREEQEAAVKNYFTSLPEHQAFGTYGNSGIEHTLGGESIVFWEEAEELKNRFIAALRQETP